MMLVDVADRHQIDARRSPVELIDDLEVDPDLLDFRRSVQLVVGVETGAGMFEFDLGVEDDVVGDRVGRQQYEAGGIEAVLPLRRWPRGFASRRI